MQWIFQRIIERLVVKLIAMMGSEWDARVEMHLSDTRAELLRRAKQFEAEETLGLDEVAASLRAQAEALGKRGEAPASDMLAVAMSLKDENLREPDSIQLPEENTQENEQDACGPREQKLEEQPGSRDERMRQPPRPVFPTGLPMHKAGAKCKECFVES